MYNSYVRYKILKYYGYKVYKYFFRDKIEFNVDRMVFHIKNKLCPKFGRCDERWTELQRRHRSIN